MNRISYCFRPYSSMWFRVLNYHMTYTCVNTRCLSVIMEVSRKRSAEEGMQDITKQLDEEGTRRLAEVGMQDILSQFEVSDNSIQISLNQIGHDISDIKERIDKKKPKVTLADINAKLDIILQYLEAQN